jgi:DNA-binding HxlR family transcriptional regulator
MKRPASRRRPAFRSGCPLASTLDLVGDKWSLLILRGMFTGASRYGDFLKQPEAIATNVLAERLERLEHEQLIQRFQDEAGVGRYRLTRRGADLLPALQALARWGYQHIEGRWPTPDWFMNSKPEAYYPPGRTSG